MKLGCIGCLAVIVGVLVVVGLALGLIFLSINIFGEPDIRPVAFSRNEGYSAQHKLYEVILRQAGRSARKDPIVLTEREVNAFLSRHLQEAAGLPLAQMSVKLSKGEAHIQGQTTLKSLVRNPVLAWAIPYLPDKRLDQPLWVTIKGQVGIEPASGNSRYGTLTVNELLLGRQPLSSFLLYALMGPSGGGLLRWPVPAVVESVQIDDGQAIIRTR